MWARVIECMLAWWLTISPCIFQHEAGFLWTNDLTCGALVLLFALLSFHSRLPQMHLLNLPIAFWLLGLGFTSQQVPLPAALENHLVLGMLLLIFTLVPSESEHPSRSWRNFYQLLRNSPKGVKDDLLP